MKNAMVVVTETTNGFMETFQNSAKIKSSS